MSRVLVQAFLAGTYAVFPLKILRYSHIPGISYQQYNFLPVVILFGIRITGEILQVVIMRKEYPGDIRVLCMQVIKNDQAIIRQAVFQLIKP